MSRIALLDRVRLWLELPLMVGVGSVVVITLLSVGGLLPPGLRWEVADLGTGQYWAVMGMLGGGAVVVMWILVGVLEWMESEPQRAAEEARRLARFERSCREHLQFLVDDFDCEEPVFRGGSAAYRNGTTVVLIEHFPRHGGSVGVSVGIGRRTPLPGEWALYGLELLVPMLRERTGEMEARIRAHGIVMSRNPAVAELLRGNFQQYPPAVPLTKRWLQKTLARSITHFNGR